MIEKLEGIARIACFLAYFVAPGNGVDENFGLWRGAKQILDSFSIFLRLIIPKHLAEDNGVVKVSVIEVHIRQKILVQRTEKCRHIGFLPSRVFQQDHGSGNGAAGEVVEINSGNILAIALRKKALG